MTAKSLLFAAALCLCSCSKESTPGGGSGANARFEVTVACENRPYDYNEAIESVITVQATDAGAGQFLLCADISGGTASLTVEGESFVSGHQTPYDYQIVNTGGSFATLHLCVTPQANDAADYGLDVRLRISTPDGTSAVERLLHIDVANKSQIEAVADYNPAAIEIEQMLGLTLSAEKQGFLGAFSVQFNLSEGDGELLLDDRAYRSGQSFPLQAGTTCQLRYQPSAVGVQRLSFTLSDSVCSVEVPVKIEVYNHGGLTDPGSGVYIYTADGFFYSLDRWDASSESSPEGVAILTSRNRFLLAPKPAQKRWIDPADYKELDKLPLTIFATKAEAIQDFDGKKNTAILVRAVQEGILKEARAAIWCYNYDAKNPGRWYLPSAGQLNLVAQNFEAVQACLKAIGGTPFMNHNYYSYYYLTSTSQGGAMIWSGSYYRENYPKPEYLDIIIDGVSGYYNYNFCYPVRDI